MYFSKLTDQLLLRPDNTFHYRLLDTGNKFEKKIGNKTANNKRKRKDGQIDLNSLCPRAKFFFLVFVTRLFSRSLFARSVFSRSAFSRSEVCVFEVAHGR